jgi:predicted ATPase
VLRREFRRHEGYEASEAGDSFVVAFAGASAALACAVAGQRALAAEPWPTAVDPITVRMALHTGDVELEENGYRDLVLHHAARILVAGHGGQILCSEITAGLLRRNWVMKAEVAEPGVKLVDLGIYRLRDVVTPERLFQVSYPGMSSLEFPPLNATPAFTSNLPLQFTRFFGRREEIERLTKMLSSGEGQRVGDERSRPDASLNLHPSRLVTLTGPGGSGKTRLALEVAERCVAARRGAVWFVPLADLSDPRLIIDAIRDALHLTPSPEAAPLEQVVAALSHQPTLLVLDNFEHLVAAGAPLIRTLRERVPTLQCLVTSRQRLEVEGEREFPVLPLPTPEEWNNPEQLSLYESVQLFVDRAQAVQPDFQVTNANAAAVAELCHRLEGIPLALELAAARIRLLTPAQMLAHLEHRLDFQTSSRRDATARHRTLRAAVDWSYELLSSELQQFFAWLSVFRGGWTLQAAAAVCEESAALDYLSQLQACSLIVAEEISGESRFRMLETLREYG